MNQITPPANIPAANRLKSIQRFVPECCVVLLLAACIAPATSFAQVLQQFSIKYDAELAIDPNRATDTGLSQSAINGIWGVMGGSVSIANIEDTVSFSKETYSIQSIGTPSQVLSIFITGDLVRHSFGKITGGKLNTLQYADTRPGIPQLTTQVNEKKKTITFYDGQKLIQRIPYQAKIHDVLSLPYVFIGRLPAKPVTVSFSDGKSIKQATFDVQKVSLKLPSGQWETIKLTRRIASSDDASVEYWLRATDGIPLRIRIGMNQRYGAVLDMKSIKVPDKVLPY